MRSAETERLTRLVVRDQRHVLAAVTELFTARVLAMLVVGVCCAAQLVACGEDDAANAICGDGVLEVAETCDDGNLLPGDGCSLDCTAEAGWNCEGVICVPVCGDSLRVGAETCDDGNNIAGDGCSAACTTEGSSSELCDDAQDNDGDGLADCEDPDCAASCPAPGPEVACSDGIDNDGDSAADCADSDCDSSCALPDEEDCAVAGDEDSNGLADCADPACTCVCGDGVTQDDEQCDDGAENSDTAPDACRTSCSPAFCGDGVVDTGEECDGTSEGSGAACLDCTFTERPGCGDSDATIIAEVNRPVVEVNLPFSDASDDAPTDATCGTRGGTERDVLLRFPTAGRYLIEAVSSAASGRLVLSELSDCPAGTSVRTCSAPTTRSNAWLTVDVETDSVRWLRADAFASDVLAGLLRVSQVDAVLAAGQSCVVDDVRSVCEPGSQCLSNGGADPICVPNDETAPLTGDPCTQRGALACGNELVCRGEPLTCQAQEAATCAELPDFDSLAESSDDGSLRWSPLLAASGATELRSTCDNLMGRAAVRLARDRRDWVRVVAMSDAGAPVGLSTRGACTLVNSETQCQRSDSGEAELWLEPGSGEVVLIVAGLGRVQLSVSDVPVLADSAACGADVEGRCAPGSSCLSGACVNDLAGSCSDPIPAIDAGIGNIADSGLLVGVDMAGAEEFAQDCGDRESGSPETPVLVPYLEQVVAFEAPETGRYEVSLRGAGPRAGVRVSNTCLGLPFSAVCSASVSAVGEYRRGAQVRAVVSSLDVESFAISIRLIQALADIGEACETDSACMNPFVCAEGVCARPVLPENAECVPGVEACSSPSQCVPDGSGSSFRCGAGIVGFNDACDRYLGLPVCSAGLTCQSADGAAAPLCLPVVGGEGDACARTENCGSGLFCVEGVCVVGGAGDAGSPCAFNSDCNEGLACSTVAGFCQPLSEFICSGSSVCPEGLVCNAVSACVVPAESGGSCDAERPCAAGFDCTTTPDGNVCTVRLAGLDEACVASSGCLPELYCDSVCRTRRPAGGTCRSTGPADQCEVGTVCRLDFSTGTERCVPE